MYYSLVEGYSDGDIVEGLFGDIEKDFHTAEKGITGAAKGLVSGAVGGAEKGEESGIGIGGNNNKSSPPPVKTTTPTPTTLNDTPTTLNNTEDPVSYKGKQLDKSLINVLKALSSINDKTENMFTKYQSTITNFKSITELGNPENNNILNYIENVLIKFIDLSDSQVLDMLKKNGYCNPTYSLGKPKNDIIYEIMIMSQHIYELSYLTPINDINIVYINNIIERLSPYLTDAFQKVLNGLKLCNPNNTNAYLPLQLIFTKMFKYNKTDVNLGLLDGLSKIFMLIKDRPTIEIVVIVLAVAFIASKIFDMFRVKVEV